MTKTAIATHFAETHAEALLRLCKAFADCGCINDIGKLLEEQLSQVLPYQSIILTLAADNQAGLTSHLLSGSAAMAQGLDKANAHPVPQPLQEEVKTSFKPMLFFLEAVKESNGFSIQSLCYSLGSKTCIAFPLRAQKKYRGALWIYRHEEEKLSKYQMTFCETAAALLATTILGIQQASEANTSPIKNRLPGAAAEEEGLLSSAKYQTLEQELVTAGTSDALQQLLHLVSQVAYSDSTVLLFGETGTGKELIANAIHAASTRRDKPMIRVNCAALPANLIESELFGHEKGSFTGAWERRIGKFELAHKSTLFLDEIGELPMELQVKLLRAIQEKEIERVGGRDIIRTDVRIIAATNRNLQMEVANGRFRHDLYYRLNVFPIALPALRDRKEDIPILAAYFMTRMSKKSGKKVTSIAAHALKQLMDYHWPGNIRELEHLIERTVLLTTGAVIKQIEMPSTNKKDAWQGISNGAVKTIHEMEREYILSVLEITNGKIHGAGGAAELLKIPATTLSSKMQKLGIKKMHR
ncbi:MAG TPA: sigma 54-interacting transcriptional regulator [Chitinophagaceae bacterium]|nr:sigma 54-interacting transcriptional regulator [Chitinophagaceae bacterium]